MQDVICIQLKGLFRVKKYIFGGVADGRPLREQFELCYFVFGPVDCKVWKLEQKEYMNRIEIQNELIYKKR